MDISLRGKKLLELELFKDINIKLNRIDNLLNIALLGPSGIGKTARIYLLLEKLYDDSIYKVKNNTTVIKYKTIKIEIKYYMSNYHLDFDLSKYKYKKCIINQFLVPYMKSINMMTFSKKILILRNIHILDKNTINILINIIEKYTKTTIFILIGENIKNKKLKSYFCIIKFPNLLKEDIIKFINNIILTKTNINLSIDNINSIINKSLLFKNTYNLNNIKKIVEMSCITGKYIDFSDSITNIIDEIFDIIAKKKIRFNKIVKIKEMLYKIFSYNYPIIDIIKYIQRKIINKHSDNNELIYEIIKISSDISKKIILSNKEIMYLEYFIISYLNLLNMYNIN